MEGKIEDSLPLVGLLAPNKDLAVVACRSKNVAVFRVRPRNTPDRTFVTITMIIRMIVVLGGNKVIRTLLMFL